MPTTVVRQEVPLFTEQWDARLDEAFEYLRAEQPDAAYEAFMRHLQSHPNDENAYEGAAVALLQQTRWDEAQQLVERGRAACPNSAVLAARQTWLWVYLTQESQRTRWWCNCWRGAFGIPTGCARRCCPCAMC
jgi:hypothetical protein